MRVAYSDQSSYPVCGFSMMDQVTLFAVPPGHKSIFNPIVTICQMGAYEVKLAYFGCHFGCHFFEPIFQNGPKLILVEVKISNLDMA